MSAYEPFTVEVAERGDHVLVTPRGELDMATASELEDALRPHVQGGAWTVLDLSELAFMDSTGVRVLIWGHHEAKAATGRWSVVRAKAHSEVARALDVSGVHTVLDTLDAPPPAAA